MSLETATHTATRRTVVAGNTTPFTKVIALISLLTVPAIESANAALVSPSSPAFGDNGY